jgi:hypothetical protein
MEQLPSPLGYFFQTVDDVFSVYKALLLDALGYTCE